MKLGQDGFVVRDHEGRAARLRVFRGRAGRRAAAKLLTRSRPGGSNHSWYVGNWSSSAARTAFSTLLSLKIPATAQLGHDASQERPARLSWQQVDGCRDYATLTVRY